MIRWFVAAAAAILVITIAWCSLPEPETAAVDDSPVVKQAREAAEAEIERRRQEAQRRLDAAM
jgi:hypothetical protein